MLDIPGPSAAHSARDRLLLVAAQLLDGGDRSFSTRMVCQLAGVTAPTLYHHFASKQGLIDAVMSHGFSQYVSAAGSPELSPDPIQDLREGWDRHVLFGLEHPSFYALLYGRVEPGRPCAVTAPALAALVNLLNEIARRAGLVVTPTDAAAAILASNVGVTLSLIAQPEMERDHLLSSRVREAILSAVLAPNRTQPARVETRRSRETAAIALSVALDDDPHGLTPGERTLMHELLVRLTGPYSGSSLAMESTSSGAR